MTFPKPSPRIKTCWIFLSLYIPLGQFPSTIRRNSFCQPTMVHPCPVYCNPAFPKGEDSEKGICLFLFLFPFIFPIQWITIHTVCIILAMVNMLLISCQYSTYKTLKNSKRHVINSEQYLWKKHLKAGSPTFPQIGRTF